MTAIDFHDTVSPWIGVARQMRWTGGLAAWQERRVRDYVDDNLSGDVTLAALAGACRLSASHFSVAFKTSFGCSPHRFLLKRRVELAKRLLLATDLSLVGIAISAGFADQSHFTRIFGRFMGITPGAWRRAWKSPGSGEDIVCFDYTPGAVFRMVNASRHEARMPWQGSV
jgi:AraC-like DNA-binding protein